MAAEAAGKRNFSPAGSLPISTFFLSSLKEGKGGSEAGGSKQRQEELEKMGSDTLFLLRLLRNSCLGMGQFKMSYFDGKCLI